MCDFELAVCSEMVFMDLPIIDRVRRIAELGFAVEIWSWHDKDLQALADTGARFSSMTGYLHGDLIDPTTADDVVRTAELSIKAAETLGVPRLNLHTAELVDGKAARPRYRSTGEMWATAMRTLERIGELGAATGVTFCVENLNTIVDHPGVPLARAKDTLALVEAIGHPNVKDDARSVSRPDRRGESDRAGAAMRRCYRRDPGRRRAGPLRAGHRRDQLPGDREGVAGHGLCRDRRSGGLGVRGQCHGIRGVPRGVQLVASRRKTAHFAAKYGSFASARARKG